MNQELLVSAVRQHELAEVADRLNAQLQREMTERKLMEKALLNSAKLAASARLASTMAHEINNPLTRLATWYSCWLRCKPAPKHRLTFPLSTSR